MMEPVTIALALAQYAPSLIKWLTGNEHAENVAQAVVDVASKVTGAATAEGSLELIRADPKLAAEFADKVAEREQELAKAYLADVDSARKMQIAALQQDDIFSKRFVYYFAIAWSAFAMFYFCWATFGVVANQRMADTILGVLIGTCLASFFQFFYGSSSRSQQKDDTIKHLITK